MPPERYLPTPQLRQTLLFRHYTHPFSWPQQLWHTPELRKYPKLQEKHTLELQLLQAGPQATQAVPDK